MEADGIELPAPFKLVKPLSQSLIGLSVVAENTETGARAVCRIFPIEHFAHSDWSYGAFCEYCARVRALKSPFVVPYSAISKDAAHVYAFRDFIDGQTVMEQSSGAPIEEKGRNVLFAIWKIIVRTVVHLHQNDLFPNFLKLNDIFVTPQNGVLLADLYPPPPPRMNIGMRKDMSDVALLAPELVTQMKVDRAADVWSLGVLLTYLMTGKLPWNTKNRFSMMRQISMGSFETDVVIPSEIAKIVAKTIVCDPNARIKCDELLKVRPLRESRSSTRPKHLIAGQGLPKRSPVVAHQLMGLAKKIHGDRRKSPDPAPVPSALRMNVQLGERRTHTTNPVFSPISQETFCALEPQ